MRRHNDRVAADGELVEDAVCHRGLWHPLQIDLIGSGEDRRCIRVRVKADARLRNVIDHDGIRALALEFCAAVLEGTGRFGLGREGDDQRRSIAMRGYFGKDVRRRFELQNEATRPAQLVGGYGCRAEVRDGGGADDGGRSGQAVEDGNAHLGGGGDSNELAAGRWLQRGRS